jgi:hypothetical protein
VWQFTAPAIFRTAGKGRKALRADFNPTNLIIHIILYRYKKYSD